MAHLLCVCRSRVAARLGIDAVSLVPAAALAWVFSITLHFLAAACLASPPNPLALVHGCCEALPDYISSALGGIMRDELTKWQGSNSVGAMGNNPCGGESG